MRKPNDSNATWVHTTVLRSVRMVRPPDDDIELKGKMSLKIFRTDTSLHARERDLRMVGAFGKTILFARWDKLDAIWPGKINNLI